MLTERSLTLFDSTGKATMENMRRFLKKLEIELPYDPSIPLLDIHTEETQIERDVYLNVHYSTIYNSQDMVATYVHQQTNG